MAVEIPVVIDIEGAFQDAANRVSSAIKPLQQKINSSTGRLELKVGIDEKGHDVMKSVSELLTVIEKKQGAITRKSVSNMSELSAALEDAESRLIRLYAIEDSGSPLTKKQEKEIQALRETIIAIKAVQEQRLHGVKLIEEEADAAIRAKRAEEDRMAVIAKSANTMSELSLRMTALTEQIRNTNPNSPQWTELMQMLRQTEVEVERLREKMQSFGRDNTSLNKLSYDLQNITKQFNALGRSEMFGATGAPTTKLRSIQAAYADTKTEIDKISKALTAEYEARKKAVEEAEKEVKEQQRLAHLIRESTQSRRYDDAVLKMTGNSMRILQEQERVLSARLSKAKFGSENFRRLSEQLQQVKRSIQEARAQMDGAEKSFDKMGASAKRSTVSINNTNTALRRQSKILTQLRSLAGMYVSVFAAFRFLRNIRETTAELELQRVALGGILRDTETASQLFRQIKAAALKSPFEIKDLLTYTKQLSAYRIETEKLFDVTMRLADVSAGLGVDMNRLILAYGQVRAASVLRGQELRQFTEAGVPLVELLAEKFRQLGREGTTTADVFQLISKRAVSFSMIEEIFNDMTDAGGIFYKMQEKQSETLKGQWMKLRDALTIMYDEIGNTSVVHGAMTGLIKDLMALTSSWRETFRWIEVSVAAMVTYSTVAKASAIASAALTKAEAARLAITKAQTLVMPRFIAAILGETAAKKVSHFVTRQLTIAQYNLATATTVVGRAFWGLYAALLANPYAAVAAAVIALAGGIIAIARNSREAEVSVDSLQKALEAVKNQASKTKDVESLIDIYEKLSNTADRTKKEQEKLERVTRELARSFPTAVSGINDETGALTINIEKVKELTAAELKLKEVRLEREGARAEKRIAELEAERKSILKKVQAGGYYYTGSTGQQIFHELSGKEWTKYAVRIEEIETELQQLKSTAEEVNEALLIGPLPDTRSQVEKTSAVWKETLKKIQSEKVAAGASVIFTPDDIDKMEDIADLYKKVKKEIEDAKKTLEGLLSLQKTLTDEGAKASNNLSIEQTKKNIDFLETVVKTFGMVFGSTKTGHQQDPFIAQLQERMKFMKDFKKGYEDLQKYLGSSQALDEEAKNMRARGLSLGISEGEQKQAATDIAGWYARMREEAFKKAQKYGAKGTLDQFLAQEIKGTSDKSKTLREFQKLIQSLWDAETDIKTSDMEKNFERALKKLSDDIKRSEAARNFYHDILDITGDKDLAETLSISVYGDPGAEIGERIKNSIGGALDKLNIDKTTGLGKTLMDAASAMDFREVMRNIDELPKELQDEVKNAAAAVEKYNIDIAKSYAKLLMQYDEIEQQRVDITNKAAKDIETIEKGLALELAAIAKSQASEEQKAAAKQRAEDRAALATAAVDRDSKTQLSRLEDDYRLFFSTVGVISTQSARKVAKKQKELITDQFVRGEISLSKYKRELKEIEQQLDKYSGGFDKLQDILSGKGADVIIEELKRYEDGLRGLASTAHTKFGIWTPPEEAKTFLSDIDRVLNFGNFAGIFKKGAKISIVREANDAAMKAWTEAKRAMKSDEVAGMEADAAAAGVINNAADKMREGANNFAQAVAAFSFAVKLFGSFARFVENYEDDLIRSTGDYSLRDRKVILSLNGSEAELPITSRDVTTALTSLESGWGKIMQMDLYGGIADIVNGFNGLTSKVKTLNEDIKIQSEIIDDLDYQYSRLDNSIQKAFGSDYITNYNKQLEALYAKQAAYEEQARLEGEKGKKSDQEKIKEYENNARAVGDQIMDMKTQLSEFFAGTDITSAAKDFASSWIEAYKEFGSTTDAMKEKFQDMIQEMIVNSLAAEIMQAQLKRIFDLIDTLSQDDSQLSASDIAQIAALANEVIPQANDALMNTMAMLNTAGYNIRQQPGQFTGIKRNFANATEESINGLTQAMNVNNFYMSHLPTLSANVAQILAIMSGGTAENPVTGSTFRFNNEIALQYMSALPSIDEKMADLLRTVKSVVSDKNSATNINVVAVRA